MLKKCIAKFNTFTVDTSDAKQVKKKAFITQYDLFEFTRMGYGLCNALATFTRDINLVLYRLYWKIAQAFLDDVLVLGTLTETHLDNLRQTKATLW